MHFFPSWMFCFIKAGRTLHLKDQKKIKGHGGTLLREGLQAFMALKFSYWGLRFPGLLTLD